MTDKKWQQIRETVEGVLDQGTVVLVISADSEAAPGSTIIRDSSFSPDLTIPEFIEHHAPKMSESRVADLCRDGHFPDTVAPNGSVVRGAYKLGRCWFITPEGIHERQRLARTRDLRQETPAEEEFNEEVPDPITAGSGAQIAARQIRPAKARNGKAPRRARQDAWKEAKKVS
jgi:hypothetical protein